MKTHDRAANSKADIEIVASANVLRSIDEILERSSILRSLLREGKIGIAGGIYSVENGRVHFIKKIFVEPQLENLRQTA